MSEIKTTIGIIVCLMLSICFDTFEHKELIPNYYLLAIDLPENMSLCYSNEGGPSYSEIIPATIFEAQWNDRFIVLKSHPEEFEKSVKKDLYESFLKELRNDSTKKNIGYTADTLTEKEYSKLRHSEGFTKVKTLYYLVDTKDQNQDPLLFLTEKDLTSAIKNLNVGELPNKQYYETLDKEG